MPDRWPIAPGVDRAAGRARRARRRAGRRQGRRAVRQERLPEPGNDGHFRRAGAAEAEAADPRRLSRRGRAGGDRAGFRLLRDGRGARRRSQPVPAGSGPDRRAFAAPVAGGRGVRRRLDPRRGRPRRAQGRSRHAGALPRLRRFAAQGGDAEARARRRGGRARNPRGRQGAGRSRHRRRHLGGDRPLHPRRNDRRPPPPGKAGRRRRNLVRRPRHDRLCRSPPHRLGLAPPSQASRFGPRWRWPSPRSSRRTAVCTAAMPRDSAWSCSDRSATPAADL